MRMVKRTIALGLICFACGCDLLLGIEQRVQAACVAGATSCEDGIRSVCAQDGLGLEPFPCPAGEFCESGGECTQICVAGASRCEGGERLVCRSDGSGEDAETCPESQLCVTGDAACSPAECFEADGEPVAAQTSGDCQVRRCVAGAIVEETEDEDLPSCGWCDAGAVVPSVVALARGTALGHACALACDGRVACWGANVDGQLGIGLAVGSSNVPRWVPLDGPATHVTVGHTHTCVLLEDGRSQCFGGNGQGQVIPGAPSAAVGDPRVMVELPSSIDIGAGGRSTCAVDASGVLRCFGLNDNAQLGVANPSNPIVEVPMPSTPTLAARVFLGTAHACSVHEDGGLVCWGGGELTGRGFSGPGTLSPGVVSGIPPLLDLAIGDYHSCGVSQTGTVHCFGGNGDGQADPSGGSVLVPNTLPVASSAHVGAGFRSSCSGGPSGVQCWGPQYAPIYTLASLPVDAVAVYWTHGCVLSAGLALCWGDNQFGQAGIGTSTLLVAVPTLVEWPPTE